MLVAHVRPRHTTLPRRPRIAPQKVTETSRPMEADPTVIYNTELWEILVSDTPGKDKPKLRELMHSEDPFDADLPEL